MLNSQRGGQWGGEGNVGDNLCVLLSLTCCEFLARKCPILIEVGSGGEMEMKGKISDFLRFGKLSETSPR